MQTIVWVLGAECRKRVSPLYYRGGRGKEYD